MKYTLNQIKTAFELAEIPQDFANRIIGCLPEAVEKLRLTDPETLADLFEQFCLNEKISEDELKSQKRNANLVGLRLKFTKLAKEKFSKKATQYAIGKVLFRDHASVLRYFRIIKSRELKSEKLNKLKNGL